MSNTVIKMPQLGESVAEGTIGRWLKQPGDRVERDEPLVEIQTDKVNAEVPSPVAGILQRILLPEGTTATVKTDMAIIGDEPVEDADSRPPATPAPAPNVSAGAPVAATNAPATDVASGTPAAGSAALSVGPAASMPRAEDAPAAQGPEGTTARRTPADSAAAAAAPMGFTYDQSASGGVVGHRDEEPAASGEGPGGRRFYTPVVLRMAEEHGLDVSRIPGTAAHGRVTRKDVERAIANGTAPQVAGAHGASPGMTAPGGPGITSGRAEPTQPAAERVDAVAPRPSAPVPTPAAANAEDRPLTPMRRAIADHMQRAHQDIPDAWSLTEIDMTRLVRYRDSVQAGWRAREGYELSYLPFFIKAVIAGLRAAPELNATFAGDHITLHRTFNLGIAVSVEGGLIVPVLRAADSLSIAGLARTLRTLIDRTRSGKLGREDLEGGTFTVNNPGSLGSIMSKPIVPVGQSGIVTMEAIVKRPVVTPDDAIAVRSMMHSCLSFDHRVLDGSGALLFLRTIKQQLETLDYPIY
ncbi:MAG: hypothetical protein NVSMB2_18940 [Chloroflexota bacterium]